VRFSEQNYEPSGYMKGREFLEQVTDYQFLKRCSIQLDTFFSKEFVSLSIHEIPLPLLSLVLLCVLRTLIPSAAFFSLFDYATQFYERF